MRLSVHRLCFELLFILPVCLCGDEKLEGAPKPHLNTDDFLYNIKHIRSSDPFAKSVQSNKTYYAGSKERYLDNHAVVENWNDKDYILKFWRIEQIKERFLQEAGLSGPVNVTGFTVPQIPSLLKQIEEINSKYMVTHKKQDFFKPSLDYADQLMSDQPAHSPVNSETMFFVAQNAPEWIELPDNRAVIYFNFSDQDPSALESAHLSIWVQPGDEATHLKHKKKKYHNHRHSDKIPPSKVVVDVLVEVIVYHFNPKSQKAIYGKKVHIKKCPLQSKDAHWMRLNMTEEVRSWLLEPSLNFGFTIRTETRGASPMVTKGMFSGVDYLPVMELQLSSDPSDRRRRFAKNLTCEGVRKSVCCKDFLIVNFVDLHWDFIVAPKAYEANLCRGSCPFLYAHKYAHIVLIQKILKLKDAKYGACCGARKSDPLKMIYYDGAKIRIAAIKDMVVLQCGCS